MGTAPSANYHALVEVELNRERAAALGRAGRRVGEAIEACSRARAALADASRDGTGDCDGDGDDRTTADRARDDYRAAYARYQQVRREFCIQREANRLYDQSMVDRFYPPPDPPARLPH